MNSIGDCAFIFIFLFGLLIYENHAQHSLNIQIRRFWMCAFQADSMGLDWKVSKVLYQLSMSNVIIYDSIQIVRISRMRDNRLEWFFIKMFLHFFSFLSKHVWLTRGSKDSDARLFGCVKRYLKLIPFYEASMCFFISGRWKNAYEMLEILSILNDFCKVYQI